MLFSSKNNTLNVVILMKWVVRGVAAVDGLRLLGQCSFSSPTGHLHHLPRCLLSSIFRGPAQWYPHSHKICTCWDLRRVYHSHVPFLILVFLRGDLLRRPRLKRKFRTSINTSLLLEGNQDLWYEACSWLAAEWTRTNSIIADNLHLP